MATSKHTPTFSFPVSSTKRELSLIHIYAIVEEDVPLLNIPPIDDTDPTSSKIGEFIAELIPDGACLQMGQGKVPNAILKCLGDKKDLGIHTEVFSDNLLPLIESGVVNGLSLIHIWWGPIWAV